MSLVSASLIGYGLAAADSLGLGLGLTACGWVFTGTALVAAQLDASTRRRTASPGPFIAVAYVLRAIGDVGNGVLSWLSPIGWYQAMHQFSGLRWWPALLMLAAAGGIGRGGVLRCSPVVTTAPASSPPDRARPERRDGLQHGLGLAWRLHRGAVVGWAAGHVPRRAGVRRDRRRRGRPDR